MAQGYYWDLQTNMELLAYCFYRLLILRPNNAQENLISSLSLSL